MHNGDVLGDKGRKALNACVKVKIYGKPETRRYDRDTVLNRLRDCYTGSCGMWLNFDRLLPASFFDENGCKVKIDYNIIDIRNALINCDKKKCVEKYPEDGPGSDKLRDLIDKRRADVEREFEEVKADPDRRKKYSWVVAQRRVRDCFAGSFAEDHWAFFIRGHQNESSYSISDIHNAVVSLEKESERAETKRATLLKLKENAEAAAAVDTNIQHYKYSQLEAFSHLRDCCYHIPIGCLKGDLAPEKLDKPKMAKATPSYDIFDIHQALLQLDDKRLFQKYPEKGPGSEELKKLIVECRNNLEEEYQKATSQTRSGPIPRKYSGDEAER